MARRKAAPTRPDYIKWLLVAGALALAAVVALYGWQRYVRSHPGNLDLDRSRYPIAGIDVSNHNGKVDFKQVRDDNIQFVIIKASEGGTYRDPSFERHLAGARKAGLVVGAYHFFRKNREGDAQARNLMAAVRGKQLDLPLVIDVEDWGNDIFVSQQTIHERVDRMVQVLRDNGYHVMIYTNGNGYKKYYQGHLDDCDLWLCSLNHPDRVIAPAHRFQQYSHNGTVRGASGDVDLNIYRGSKRDWEHYLASLQTPPNASSKR